MEKTIRTLWPVIAILLMAMAFSRPAHADYRASQSPLYWGTFVGEAPVIYSWQGLARVDYRRSGGWVLIQKVDLSAVIYQAARPNSPADMVASVNMDVFQNGRYVTTIYPRYTGSYMYSPINKVFGGVDYPNIWLGNPTFRVNVYVTARGGYGGYNRSWSFSL